MSDQNTIIYLAGYTDGDGCFSISSSKVGNRTKFACQFVVTTTYRPAAELFLKTFGGSCTITTNTHTQSHWKPLYRYTVCGKKAKNLASQLLPHLVQRRKEAECFLRYFETNTFANRFECMDTLKNLRVDNLVSEKDITTLKSRGIVNEVINIDFIYMAGLIDAECCLGLSRYKSKSSDNWIYKAHWTMNDTKIPCIEFLYSRLGGVLHHMQRKGRNQIQWRISGKIFREALPKILPYLRNKKQVAVKLMEFFALNLPNGGARHTESFRLSYSHNLAQRDQIFQSIHLLNHKGC